MRPFSPEEEVDCIIDIFDDLFLQGDFRHAEWLLRHLSLKVMSTQGIVCILTATRAAKDQMPWRKQFVSCAQGHLIRREPDRWRALMENLS